MNPIRNGGRQDLLSLHLDVALPRPRASISVTALRFSHREVLEQGGARAALGKNLRRVSISAGHWDMHKMPLLNGQVKWRDGNNGRRANVNAHIGSGT